MAAFTGVTGISSPLIADRFPTSEAGPSKPAVYRIPSKQARPAQVIDVFVKDASGPIRAIQPLRRGVSFTPRNDTKYFRSTDAIVPDKTVPPPSIRSYADVPSDEFEPPSLSLSDSVASSSPACLRSSSPNSRSSTPSGFRSILKPRKDVIRIAATVEEGTLNNKEPARLRVSGRRPKLLPRDSFQLAVLRRAASEGISLAAGGARTSSQGGLPQAPGSDPEMPGSDDTAASDDRPVGSEASDAVPASAGGGSSDDEEEEEESIEEDGSLTTSSVLGIILEGAEDLLTLEEAYSTLSNRLRIVFTAKAGPLSPSVPINHEASIRIAVQPLQDNASALVSALHRDLQRLLGKVPNSEVPPSEADSSPFRGLVPLQDSTPINRLGRSQPLTPSTGGKLSPDSLRKGYTEAEVKYRREAAGVGAAALRFLAFVLHQPEVFRCFTEADLSSLLSTVMVIPRTPRLPTPNPKRTYTLSIFILGQLKVPAACVLPVKEKIVRAVEGAITETLGNMIAGGAGGAGGPAKDSSSSLSSVQIRKEGFIALQKLLSTYPAIFFQHYADLLIPCLKALIPNNAAIRSKAAQGVAAFAFAKIQTVADAQSILEAEDTPAARDAWAKARATARKCETAVVAHLKSGFRVSGRTDTVVGKQGDRKTEASALEAVFKEVIGSNTEVAWACATWAMVVTLLGEQYPSCGLAPGLDHIMNRSLQPSQNGTRPLFARTAWHHAVHAYLAAKTTTTFDKDGKLVQSFRPYAATSSSDASQQLAMLQFPVDLALEAANAPTAVVRVLTTPGDSRTGEPMRSVWMRQEKAKRRSWLETCGIGAATIVYAYSTMALQHQEQPAPQTTASSSEPAPTGESPIPDSFPVDSKLDRLDQAWSKVVRPMLSSLLEVRGIDRLKLHGWQILAALTSLKPATSAPPLDRLLSTRYLAGEAFTMEKEAGLLAFMTDLEADAIKAAEVPSWGAEWMIQRFDPLLDMFMEALIGVSGLEGVQSVKWISLPSGDITLPIGLSRVWCNLLRVLATIKADPAQLGAYADGLKSIACVLIKVLNLDPALYLPISMYGEGDRCMQDADATRVRLVYHLVDAMYQILGPEAFHAVRLDFTAKHSEETESIESTLARTSFGADAQGKPTLSGALLGSLLRTKVFRSPMPRLLKQLVVKIFAAGLAPGVSGKMLGDMTNCLPWLFETDEEMQLEVWRILATSWPDTIDLQPATGPNTSGTNHTGALLVSLLAHPFRGRDLGSFWYQHDSEADLRVWTKLLGATVQRFRAKRVGSNQGVLDTLAEQLDESLKSTKTSSSTIALSCLAAATNWLSFSPDGAANDSAVLDGTHVPVRFLGLVSSALLDSYPSPESLAQGSAEMQPASPAVGSVIAAIKTAISNTPSNFFADVIEAVRPGMARWLSDEAKMAEFDLAQKLDDLYVALLESLTGAIAAGALAATSEILDRYIDIFAPRLSLAVSAEVPRAFQAFWASSFANVVRAEDLSEDVVAFLQEVVDAVPGMIVVNGLAVQASVSQEESQAKFPGALSLASQTVPADAAPTPEALVLEDASAHVLPEEPEGAAATGEQEQLDPATQMAPVPTADYDADDSLSVADEPSTLTAANEADVEPSSEADVPFAGSEADDEEIPNLQRLEFKTSKRPIEAVDDNDGEKDVFGATGVVSASAAATAVAGPGRKGKRKARRPAAGSLAKRTKSDTALVDMETLVPESPAVASGTTTATVARDSTSNHRDEPASGLAEPSSADTRASLPSQRSLFNVAGKWLAKVPSFSGLPFFSPHHRPEDESTPVTRKIQVQEAPVSHDDLRPSPDEEPALEASTEQSVSSPRSDEPSPVESPESDDTPARSRRPRKSSKRKAEADEIALAKSSRTSKRKKAKVDGVQASKGRRTRSRSSYARSEGSLEEPIEVSDDDNDNALADADEAEAEDVKVGLGDGEDDDEDDVLLLSPESAEKSRGEEEGAIMAARQDRHKAAAAPPPAAMPNSSPASATRAARRRAAAVTRLAPTKASRRNVRQHEAESEDDEEDEPAQSGSLGRYDDAPDDTLRPPSSPSPPPRTKPQPLVRLSTPAHPTTTIRSKSASASSSTSGSASPVEARTAQQARVLHMLEEAARAREAVEQVDLEGITSLLRHINELRDAATKNLEIRARKTKARRA